VVAASGPRRLILVVRLYATCVTITARATFWRSECLPPDWAFDYTGGKAFVGGNKMTLETMIDTLSRDEKLAAMDLIWRDLAADSRSFVSPEWHETIIADRLKNPTSGPALRLAEAKAEIKDAIDARRASG
jgi:hypothetical protein